jgi:membrane protein DedA with SNARE-associated domain
MIGLRYGGLVLFAGVFADQLGVPLPGLPLLLAAGALAGAGAVHPAGALGLAVAAAVLADLLWYELGRRRGGRALRLGCRLSLEPDSCIGRTRDVFVRQGVRLLLFAKFVPALGTVAAPLAGMSGVGRRRFLLYDGLGALLWAAGYMGLGYAFSDQLEAVAASVSRTGTALALLVLGALTAYVGYRYVRRRLRRRRLRVQDLTVGEPPVVVDLRQTVDVDAAPYAVPGTLRIADDSP